MFGITTDRKFVVYTGNTHKVGMLLIPNNNTIILFDISSIVVVLVYENIANHINVHWLQLSFRLKSFPKGTRIIIQDSNKALKTNNIYSSTELALATGIAKNLAGGHQSSPPWQGSNPSRASVLIE